MSGLYLHIPFCKQACHYCNFHFSTSTKYRGQMVEAILMELELQQGYLASKKLDTIYLGGGTPSLLNEHELNALFQQIDQHYAIQAGAEITLEANPDDLNAAYLKMLAKSPVNRLSIGIQSFFEADLQYMNRAHNAAEAKASIELAKEAGFEDLTIDLIYGTPGLSEAGWAANVQTILNYEIPHISCYCLTVEPGTALDHFVKKGKAKPVDEGQAARQFEYLMDRLKGAGYEHYEISNFAKPGRYARHNSNYWLGESYLGVGPSAHSFNGHSRQWNVANNAQYIKAIEAGKAPFELEELSEAQRYNEYVMTSLRTIWGCDVSRFTPPLLTYFQQQIQVFIDDKQVHQKAGVYYLTDAGKLLADHIAMALFWVDSSD